MALYAICQETLFFNWYQVKSIDDYNPLAPYLEREERLRILIEGLNPLPAVGNFYNPDTNEFVETIPEPLVRRKFSLSFVQFWNRFTTAERRKIGYILEGTLPQGVTMTADQRIDLIWFIRFTENGEMIPLQVTKVQNVVNAMETAGIIGIGRAAEILG